MTNKDYVLEMFEDNLERLKRLSEDNIYLVSQLSVFANKIAALEKENIELREKENNGKSPNSN